MLFALRGTCDTADRPVQRNPDVDFFVCRISPGLCRRRDCTSGRFAALYAAWRFPAVTAFRHNVKAVQDYYDGLVTSVIVKDICTRLNVRDAAVLYELTVCLATSIGSLVSPKNIANTLKSAGCSISIPTIYTYLQALEDSFFFHRVSRFDVRGREVLRREEKFYLCDVGFRYSVTSSPVKDYGRILENIVYLELKRRYKR